MGAVVERDTHAIHAAGAQRRPRPAAGVVGKIERPVGDPLGHAAGGHVAKTQAELCSRPVDGEGDLRPGAAQQLERRRQRRRVEACRKRVVLCLIAGELAANAHAGAPMAGIAPHLKRRGHPAFAGPRRPLQARPCRIQNQVRDIRRRPFRLGDPAAGPGPELGRGRIVLLHECAIGGQVFGAVLHAPQPAVEPAERLGMKIDRIDPRNMRIPVLPGAEQRPCRRIEVCRQRRRGVDIGVGPAADRQRRRPDRAPVLAHRAVPPVLVGLRVTLPDGCKKRQVVDPLQPAGAPVVAQGRVGRPRQLGRHLSAPTEIVGEQTTVHEMRVVAVAVGRRAHRHDGLERRRTPVGELQAVETAPRDSDHADGAVAPGLARDPCDHGLAVGELALRVLVVEEAVGFPRPRDIDPQTRISGRRKDAVGGGIPVRGPVPLAVREVFQDGRHGNVAGRQPQARCKAPAVGEGYPEVFRDVDSRRHGPPPLPYRLARLRARTVPRQLRAMLRFFAR